jgi:hypothetical protein
LECAAHRPHECLFREGFVQNGHGTCGERLFLDVLIEMC